MASNRWSQALAALLLTSSLLACTQGEYPQKDITVVIPFKTGGGFDTYVRALSTSLEKQLPNNVNVLPRNLPGAGGRRGTSDIYRSNPDGYTIGIFNLPGVLIPQLQNQKVGYELSEITWLATMGNDPYVYSVKGDSQLTSIDDVRMLGRSVSYGATGPGSTSYVATGIVNQTLGIEFEIVTGYTGSSDYLLGLIRGDFDAAMISMSTARPYLDSGDIKALAVFGKESSDANVADAVALGAPELGQLSVMRVIGGPPNMPDEVRTILENAILAAMRDEEFTSWLVSTGNTVQPAGSVETAALVAEMSSFFEQFRQLLN